MGITTAQIRGARGILNWSQSDLSERTGISTTSIGALEKGTTQARESTLTKIQKVFEDNGIEFLPNDGLRKKAGEIKIYKGQNGFLEFYDEIFETMHQEPGEVYVSNVDERLFEKWLTRDNVEKHVVRIRKYATYKILIKSGDTYYLATPDYSEYRWMPKGMFTSVPYYIFGDKVALLLFDDEPNVIVLDYPAIAAAYRKQFTAVWDTSEKPDKKQIASG